MCPIAAASPALTDVISGQIPFMIVDLAVAIPADQGRQGEGVRRHVGDTDQGDAGSADHRRGRRAGLWRRRLVLGGGAAGTPRPIIDKLNGC